MSGKTEKLLSCNCLNNDAIGVPVMQHEQQCKRMLLAGSEEERVRLLGWYRSYGRAELAVGCLIN